MITLKPQPLSRSVFAPFGEVIETGAELRVPMNDGRFERFDDLASIVTRDGGARIGIVGALQATRLPYSFEVVERHPDSSQAFIPRSRFRFVVVVAPAGPPPAVAALRAFVSDGEQGVAYARGTWHMALIALEAGQQFLVVDSGHAQRTETHRLQCAVSVVEPA